MTFAETLSDKERRKGRVYACCACLAGCVSEVMLDSSAIIIIFFSMINAGDMLTMFSTSITPILGLLLFIPSSAINNYFGRKKVVHYSCITGCIGFLLMASAPFFGALGKYIALLGCAVYCVQRSTYGAAWYPLLDVFLRPQDRARFFGTMRFIYTCFTGTMFFVIGLVLQKDVSIWILQSVIAIAGLLMLGRDFCISRFPDNPEAKPETANIYSGLCTAMKNGALTAYSVYVSLLSIAFTSILPLTYLYLSSYVKMNKGTVQIISSVAIGGMVFGHFCYGRVFDGIKLKYLELLAHGLFTITVWVLFFMDKSMPLFPVIIGATVFVQAFANSVYQSNNSAELLTLPRPGNKTMAMAFVQTYSSLGGAIGRVVVSVILGSAMLAPVWDFHGRQVSHFQTLFLASGVMLLVLFFILPTLPSFVSRSEDDDSVIKK
ncbi:MAG: MFS transporter [Lentisphaeria bacterium]|nr:MFS transporter [Lentisphaeria bacterium]